MLTNNLLTDNSENHDLLISNLRRLMAEKKVNEAEISRRTLIPQATLHKILSGKTEDPRVSTLKTLADFFSVSMEELLTGIVSKSNNYVSTVQAFPVISWSDCINAINFISKLNSSNWNNWVTGEQLSPQSFALQSKPAMEPHFPRGTIFIIDPFTLPKDGDLVVVHFPNTGEATLRELYSDGPKNLLKALNHVDDSISLDEGISIIGVLIRSTYSFK